MLSISISFHLCVCSQSDCIALLSYRSSRANFIKSNFEYSHCTLNGQHSVKGDDGSTTHTRQHGKYLLRGNLAKITKNNTPR